MSIIHGSSYAHVGANQSPVHAVNLGGSVLSSQQFDHLEVVRPYSILESSLASVILDQIDLVLNEQADDMSVASGCCKMQRRPIPVELILHVQLDPQLYQLSDGRYVADISEPAKQHGGHPDVQLVPFLHSAHFKQISQLVQLLELGGDLLI